MSRTIQTDYTVYRQSTPLTSESILDINCSNIETYQPWAWAFSFPTFVIDYGGLFGKVKIWASRSGCTLSILPSCGCWSTSFMVYVGLPSMPKRVMPFMPVTASSFGSRHCWEHTRLHPSFSFRPTQPKSTEKLKRTTRAVVEIVAPQTWGMKDVLGSSSKYGSSFLLNWSWSFSWRSCWSSVCRYWPFGSCFWGFYYQYSTYTCYLEGYGRTLIRVQWWATMRSTTQMTPRMRRRIWYLKIFSKILKIRLMVEHEAFSYIVWNIPAIEKDHTIVAKASQPKEICFACWDLQWFFVNENHFWYSWLMQEVKENGPSRGWFLFIYSSKEMIGFCFSLSRLLPLDLSLAELSLVFIRNPVESGQIAPIFLPPLLYSTTNSSLHFQSRLTAWS